MKRYLLAFGMVMAVAISASLLSGGRSEATLNAAMAPPIANGGMPAVGAGLPDLVVISIVSNQNGPFPCDTPAGVRVTVQNVGDAAAPASFAGVSVGSQVEVIEFPALAVSQQATAYAPVVGIPSGDTYGAYVDPLNHIVESNDSNNILEVQGLAVGSLPTCTPTPTITPTPPAPTVTPTPTGFSGQDTDGDGILGSVDNCPFVFNPGQENMDGNIIDHSPPYNPSVDDKTNPLSDRIGDVCDGDNDNDTIANADEFTVPCPTPTPSPGPSPTPGPCGPPPCTSGTTGTDQFLRDTDGDRALDGVECTLGTNPTLSSSSPTIEQCGPLGDADGDGLTDRIEYCYYGTFPNSSDSDSDAALDGGSDGCEVRSFNGDRMVNVADMGMLAVGVSGAVAYHPNVDVNKDGVLNPADQGMVAAFISPPGRCPDGKPDLLVLSMKIELETGSSCAFTSTALGLRVTVRNAGNYGAGSFLLQVDGINQLLSMGLGSGQTLSIWLAGAPYNEMGGHSAFADSGQTVFESNEFNNTLTQFVPIPTLPPTCTPTPPPTATVTPTPT